MSTEADDPGFLKRWSARKLAQGDEKAEPETTKAQQVHAAPPAAHADGPRADENPQAPPPDLPDVESLNEGSDYSVFLGENVPEDLTRLALRKLWRSDPALANLDGLNDYDSDFSLAGKAVEVVKTAYRVGRGYADDAHVSDLGEGRQDQGDVAAMADSEGRDEATQTEAEVEAGAESGDASQTAESESALDDGDTPRDA